MTHLLLSQVCHRHFITTKQFLKQDNILVREAQDDFIRTALQNGWTNESIARAMGWPVKKVQYHILQVIERGSPLSASEKAADPISIEELHNGSAAAPIKTSTPVFNGCQISWSGFDQAEVSA